MNTALMESLSLVKPSLNSLSNASHLCGRLSFISSVIRYSSICDTDSWCSKCHFCRPRLSKSILLVSTPGLMNRSCLGATTVVSISNALTLKSYERPTCVSTQDSLTSIALSLRLLSLSPKQSQLVETDQLSQGIRHRGWKYSGFSEALMHDPEQASLVHLRIS